MIVCMDVDGVLADFIGGTLAILNSLYKKRHTHVDIQVWDFAKALSLTDKEVKEVYAAISAPYFALTLSDIPGASEAVKEFRARGHEVKFVTSPWDSPTWKFDRTAWLRSRFGSDSEIVFTDEKEKVEGDLLIDDSLKNISRWCAYGRFGMLWDQPWNASLGSDLPVNAVRACSWRFILDWCTRCML